MTIPCTHCRSPMARPGLNGFCSPRCAEEERRARSDKGLLAADDAALAARVGGAARGDGVTDDTAALVATPRVTPSRANQIVSEALWKAANRPRETEEEQATAANPAEERALLTTIFRPSPTASAAVERVTLPAIGSTWKHSGRGEPRLPLNGWRVVRIDNLDVRLERGIATFTMSRRSWPGEWSPDEAAPTLPAVGSRWKRSNLDLPPVGGVSLSSWTVSHVDSRDVRLENGRGSRWCQSVHMWPGEWSPDEEAREVSGNDYARVAVARYRHGWPVGEAGCSCVLKESHATDAE